ncbi:MAG: glutathione S-transferase [Nevskia sp.]|nr:glutathione S-transferase [Nevskia sp.]
MKLYDYTMAPSPRRARMFLAEKGLEPEIVQVDLRASAQLKPEFLAINPQATVPVLVLDDGQAITENLAIAAYLEAAYPEPPLLGTTPLEKARVLQWNSRAEFEGLLAVAEVLRNGHPAFAKRAITGTDDYEQIPQLAERGRARVGRFWGVLEQRLAQSPFVSGERFGMADITAVVAVDFAKVVRLAPPESCTSIRRWHEAMRARPSYGA